ncbi:helix-turn-helix domain-containing protein [Streptomyces sp. SM14]|uniref:telomere-associated protein Tap n=3 Tax=unclassified Streptomyces TaxID=2593676 RepID=UPI000CD4BB82|nr:helix-turn-helix domain-containing protein [Streptomyces sp. SM14]
MPGKTDPVEALLGRGPRRDDLPPPAERERLRTDYGLARSEVADALGVARSTVAGWESGRSEPRGETRAAYRRLLEGMAERLPPAPRSSAVAVDAPEPAGTPARPDTPAPSPGSPEAAPPTPGAEPDAPADDGGDNPGDASAEPARAASVSGRTARRPTTARRPATARRAATARAARRPAPTEDGFPDGPLAVLDGDGIAYGVGGLVLDCPATDIPGLVEWALHGVRLGAPRLHRHGHDADPLLVLTASAAERVGLPPTLEDRRTLRLPEDHPVPRALIAAKWRLTRRGFGPWTRVYRPVHEGRRQCVQLAVLPWGALDARAWANAEAMPPPELARALGDYANRVLTPRGSAAVCGLELMTALRPPTRPVRDTATGAWVSGPNPGALTEPVDPAPPEAPDEHPVLAGRHPRGHLRGPAEQLDEEAFAWARDPESLTDAECARSHAVGIDVNMAFAAAANRLNVGLGEAVHVTAPEFDPGIPGSWLVDLSHIPFDERLPNPFTPHGGRPEGPAWYATPTVAYARELGHSVAPVEAHLRLDHGAYLDAWYTRLRDAYLHTMEQLGVRAGMSPAEYLAAMADHRGGDPTQLAVLSAVKATVKGGIGKLRERPQGAGYRPGERWPALERPTWRPDIRAAVIASARVNMHRKMTRLAQAGLFPVAVLSDCAVYLSDGPGPLDFLPFTDDGKPLPGGFRVGVSPGMVKHEGTQPLLWAVQMLDEGHNPARHIKGPDAPSGDE